MDMLPMSTLSEEQRQNQHLADVAQENADRQTRSVELLDPSAQASRDRWNASQLRKHESLFSFSDNLTTLMFIVASDLSEAQRERFTSSLSLRGMNVPAHTFESVRTVFVELFCTSKSSRNGERRRGPVLGLGGSQKRQPCDPCVGRA